MRKIFFIFVIISILITFCVATGANQMTSDNKKAVSIEDLFPLRKGLHWRYKRISREGVSHYKTDYLGTFKPKDVACHLLGNPYGVSYIESTDEALYNRGVAPRDKLQNVSFYQDGEMIRLKTPLEEGNSWNGQYRLEQEERTILTAYYTQVLGWQKVNISGTSYDALLTSTTLNTIFIPKGAETGKGNYSRELIWYAPGVGIVRRTMHFLDGSSPEGVLYRDDGLEEFIVDEKSKLKKP